MNFYPTISSTKRPQDPGVSTWKLHSLGHDILVVQKMKLKIAAEIATEISCNCRVISERGSIPLSRILRERYGRDWEEGVS